MTLKPFLPMDVRALTVPLLLFLCDLLSSLTRAPSLYHTITPLPRSQLLRHHPTYLHEYIDDFKVALYKILAIYAAGTKHQKGKDYKTKEEQFIFRVGPPNLHSDAYQPPRSNCTTILKDVMKPWEESPSELLEIIFYYLNEEDLLAASGVSFLWFDVADFVLRKKGKFVYRWPSSLPKGAKDVCIIGKRFQDIDFEDIHNLELRADSTDTIPPSTFQKILKNCRNLKVLKIVRYRLEQTHVISLLTNVRFWSLTLIFESRDDFNARGYRILKENRELFTKIGIYCVKEDKLKLYNPSANSKHKIENLNVENLSVDCAGVERLKISNVKYLSLKNAFYLSSEDIIEISKLKIESFKLNYFDGEEQVWTRVFSGFKNLKSLSLFNSNCPKYLLEQINLENLKTDIKSDSDLQSIVKIVSLKNLELHLPASFLNHTMVELQKMNLEKVKFVLDLINFNESDILLEKRISEIVLNKSFNVEFKFDNTLYYFRSDYALF